MLITSGNVAWGKVVPGDVARNCVTNAPGLSIHHTSCAGRATVLANTQKVSKLAAKLSNATYFMSASNTDRKFSLSVISAWSEIPASERL
jgi:hypothetical protein